MPRIPDAELEQIKRGTDLAALVRAKGIELRPHGTGHLAGKCPFHEDATPSFIVTPEKNLFHCLGCGAGGTVIDFVMRHDGLSFRHAVEVLRSGRASALVATTAPTKHSTVRKLPPPVAYDADDQTLMAQVIDYYQERLRQTPAALAYLEKRGIRDEEAIKTFRLGFSDRTLGLRLPNKQRVAGAVGGIPGKRPRTLKRVLRYPDPWPGRCDPRGLWPEDRRKPDPGSAEAPLPARAAPGPLEPGVPRFPRGDPVRGPH